MIRSASSFAQMIQIDSNPWPCSSKSERARALEREKERAREKEKERARVRETAIAKEKARAIAIATEAAIAREKERARAREIEKARAIEKERARAIEKEKARAKEKERARAVDKERARARETEKARAVEKERARARETEKARAVEKERAKAREIEKARAIETERARAREIQKARAMEKERARAIEKERSRTREIERARLRVKMGINGKKKVIERTWSSSKKADESSIRHILCVKKKEDVKHFEQVESCFILDFDPFEPIQLSKVSVFGNGAADHNDAPDLAVVAEKGQVACRDYPHSRHLCLKFPFKTTPHKFYCGRCYCYVCDSAAPCNLWRDPILSHCHASEHDKCWRYLRQLRKQQAVAKK